MNARGFLSKMNSFGITAWLSCFATAAIVIFYAPSPVRAQSPGQETFSSPEDAMHALVQAVNSKDRVALAKIFGPEYKDLLSGDTVEDDKDLADFDAGLQESAQLQKQNDT